MINQKSSLKNVILSLIKELKYIDQYLILSKEPDENSSDIDTLITNRSSKSTSYLIKNSKLPIIFTSKKRGFAYYLSQKERIKPIDLFDLPSLSDQSIDFFKTREEESSIHSDIKILCKIDQMVLLLFKSLKKDKVKINRLLKIKNLSKNLNKSSVVNTFLKVTCLEKNNQTFIKLGIKAIDLFFDDQISVDSIKKWFLECKNNKSIRQKFFIKLISYFKFLENKKFKLLSNPKELPLIVFLGVDGSGKSTTIKNLEKSFEKINIVRQRFETKYISTFIVKIYFRIIDPLLKSKFYKHLMNLFYKPFFLLRIREFLMVNFLLIDSSKKIKSLKKLTKESMVLCDRWWVDFFVAPKNQKIIKIYPNLLSRYIKLKKPNLIFYLDVPINITLKRRPHEIREVIKIKKNLISKVLDDNFKEIYFKLKGDVSIEHNISFLHTKIYEAWSNSILK